MPIYEYVCQRCKKQIDVLQKLNDPAPGQCESCGAKGSLNRVVSRTSFILKGGGWYSDLYASPKKEDAKPAESKSEAKPADGANPDGKAAASSNGATQAKPEKTSSGSTAPAPAGDSSAKPTATNVK